MNVILLLILLVLVGISSFFGYKRGLTWTLVRLGFLLSALILSILFAPGLTEKLIISKLGITVSSPTVFRTVYSLFAGSEYFADVFVLSKPASGLLLSFLAPVAFSGLFLIGIHVASILYLISKLIIKHFSGSQKLREFSFRSRITAGILSAVTAIFAFSLVTSCVYIPLKVINDSGKVSDITEFAKSVTDFTEDDSSSRRRSVDKINNLQSLYSSIVNSAAMKITDLTFASDFSTLVYKKISTVDINSVITDSDAEFISRITMEAGTNNGDFSDHGADSAVPDCYCVLDFIEEFLPKINHTRKLLLTLSDASFPESTDLNIIETSVKDFCELSILSDNDKLILISLATDEINQKISELPYDKYIPTLPIYETLTEFKEDLPHFFEVLKVLIPYLS